MSDNNVILNSNTIINNDDYNEFICNYTNEINIQNKNKIKNKSKNKSDNLLIPTINNYKEMTNLKYGIQELKTIAKNYKLKISGNKKELNERIYNFLHFSFYILHFSFCILHLTFCILHFTFCILHFAFYILHFAFCFQLSQ